MISVVLFLILLSTKSGTTDEDIKDYDLQRLLGLFKHLTEYRKDDVTVKDVTFYLYTRQTSNLQIPLEGGADIDLIKNSKFIIHGWIDNHNRSWYHHITDEYLKKGDFNIIHVDWWRVAQSFYLSSAHNTKLVGGLVAKFILNHSFDLKKVHLIGHSLGAHISAYAAQTMEKETGTKIKRITALDPAGPGFWSFIYKQDEILSKDDADIVDAIHTDGGFLGCYLRLGTFDIYINGGTRIQPDCHINYFNLTTAGELFEDTYCSHTRSYVRFTEIINDKKYTCKKCQSWVEYVVGLCNSNDEYTFGAEDINETMQGVCFVNTYNKE